jgi:hypothetical protein
VPKFGGEKALTKHIVDDGLPKYLTPMEETSKIIEHNLKILETDPLENCSSRLSRVPSIGPKRSEIRTQAKINSLKSRLEKIMHKLYDLEPDNAPEKPLNVELCVDLYQMEKY